MLVVRLASLHLVLLALGAAAGAQGIRVNAPLAREPGLAGEDVGPFAPAADEGVVVFLADPEDGSRFEVFAAPVDAAGAWRRLSAEGAWCWGPLRAGGGRAAFLSQVPPATALDVFAAPLDGSAAAVRLHAPMATGRQVLALEAIAGGRAVWIADPSAVRRFALYSAPLDASAPAVELAAALVAEGDVTSFRVAPDGATVVFRADRLTDEVHELWSVASDGSGAPQRLSPLVAAGGGVSERYEITADGARAVFVADVSTPPRHELWSAPIDGSAPAVRLDGPSLLDGVAVDAWPSFRTTPDGATAVFRARRTGEEQVQLYAAPVDGGAAAIRIGGPILAGGGVRDVYPIPTSPSGTRVVYRAIPGAGVPEELRSAGLDGGLATRVSEPLAAWADFTRVAVAADGSRVAWVSDQTTDGCFELWSAPIDGGAPPVRLSVLQHDAADVTDLRVAPGRAVYRADARHDERFELWSVPLDGSLAPVPLSGRLGLLSDVEPDTVDPSGTWGFAADADGGRVVYRADAATDETFALWSAPLDGGAAPLELSMPLDPGAIWSEVIELAWSRDGGRLLYVATDHSSRYTRHDVLSADLARLASDGRIPVVAIGRGQALTTSADGGWVAFAAVDPCEVEPCTVRLSAAPPDGAAPARELAVITGLLEEVGFTPDGARLVYRSGYVSGPYSSSALWSVASDGGAPPVLLSVPQGVPDPGPYVGAFAQASDGRVAFQEHHDGATHVYSVTAAGGVAVALEPPGTSPGEFHLTPDGATAVLAVGNALYAVPSGGGLAVRVDPPAASDAVLAGGFLIDALGERVAFVRDRELWSAPLDPARGLLPVRLDAKPIPGGGVALPDFGGAPQVALAPDASRAVWRAEQDALGRFELFSAPLDGSAAPVRLHAPLAGEADVAPDAFAFAGPARVVFAADLVVTGSVELFTAPADGAGPPVRLSGAFPPGGGLRTPTGSLRDAFAVSPDGATVAYLAEQRTVGTIELFAVPSDGSRAPRRLNRELVPGGDVGALGVARVPFAFSPDGLLVAYLADQETDGVLELFLSYVDPPRLRRAPPPRPLR